MFHRIGGPRLLTVLYYHIASMCCSRLLTYSRTGANNLISLFIKKEKIIVIGTAIGRLNIVDDMNSNELIKINQIRTKYNYSSGATFKI